MTTANKEQPKTPESGASGKIQAGLTSATIQLIAWALLIALFLLDRILGVVEPPAPETWYGVLITIAAAEKAISTFKR